MRHSLRLVAPLFERHCVWRKREPSANSRFGMLLRRKPFPRPGLVPLFVGLVVVAALVAGPLPAHGQGASTAGTDVLVWRNQFDGLPDRPERRLVAGPATTVRSARWRVTDVNRLRVVSPDPKVAAVFRFVPAPRAGAAALRLYVILVEHPRVPGFEIESRGHLIRDNAFVPQPHYPLGANGIETALAGTPGRVNQIVIQDSAVAEIRLRRDGSMLELQVVPRADGGRPSGLGAPAFLPRPLRFTDGNLQAAASSGAAQGALVIGDRLALRFNGRFPASGSTIVVRGLAMAEAWRTDFWALWVEGGGGYLSDSNGNGALHVAGGLALHWRYRTWGAALNLGRVGGSTVLELLGGWQFSRPLGLLLGWQQLPDGSSLGLGVSLRF